jgi:hypothetical protein
VDLRVIEWGDVDWIYVAQDRVQWRASYEYGNEISDSVKCY